MQHLQPAHGAPHRDTDFLLLVQLFIWSAFGLRVKEIWPPMDLGISLSMFLLFGWVDEVSHFSIWLDGWEWMW
jgi:hypothetical protein